MLKKSEKCTSQIRSKPLLSGIAKLLYFKPHGSQKIIAVGLVLVSIITTPVWKELFPMEVLHFETKSNFMGFFKNVEIFNASREKSANSVVLDNITFLHSGNLVEKYFSFCFSGAIKPFTGSVSRNWYKGATASPTIFKYDRIGSAICGSLSCIFYKIGYFGNAIFIKNMPAQYWFNNHKISSIVFFSKFFERAILKNSISGYYNGSETYNGINKRGKILDFFYQVLPPTIGFCLALFFYFAGFHFTNRTTPFLSIFCWICMIFTIFSIFIIGGM